MTEFKSWFVDTYHSEVPQDLLEYLQERPDGVTCESATLYNAEDMMAYTEERELEEKGFVYLGTGNTLDVFLLRAADGEVVLVDQTDFESVDATFKSLSTLRNLLNLQ